MSFAKDKYAIVGLGVTKQGRVPGVTPIEMKTNALRLAVEDAGLKPKDIGGWIYQPGLMDVGPCSGGDAPKILGMNPSFMWQFQSGGTSAVAGTLAACNAIEAGLADYVAIGYGDTALSGQLLVGSAGRHGAVQRDNSGMWGMYSPGADHALAAQRHMHLFGTTKEQLGMIPITAREYANMRPDAYLHDKPLTMADYLGARPIASPLGKFDYCLTADGGMCFIVTTAQRARDLKTKPVYVSGIGLSHSLGAGWNRTQYEELHVKSAKEAAFKQAGITVEDIDVAQIYDCFSITVLLTLEGYGFCKKGEGGAFVADGNLRLSGRIPTNTAGGELSWSYMQGFTPMCEGLRQMRGESGPTQVKDAEFTLVTGHGGTTTGVGFMEYAEACMILRRG